MCPGIAPAYNDNEGACPNLTALSISEYFSWSSRPAENDATWRVKIYLGSINIGLRSYTNVYALCK